MKQRIIFLLVAVIMCCGLLTTTSCTSKERQLDAALKAANKGFPQSVGDGVVLEGFFMEGDNIDIAVTVEEAKQTTEITPKRLKEMHDNFIVLFTQISHQTKEFHDFLQLISDNNKTMSMSVTLVPSKKKHSIKIYDDEIKKMLAAGDKSSVEMAQDQLDFILDAERQQYPINMGSLILQSIKRTDTDVVWQIDVTDSLIFAGMSAQPEIAKQHALENLNNPENHSLNRAILSADCGIVYSYTDKATGKVFDLKITKQDLRDIQKNAVSTKIK